MKTIWVENSTWNNIGDGFYQSSLVYQIRKLFPEHLVVEGDGPASRTFRPSAKFAHNVFDAMEYQDADVYIFSGPMLRQLSWRYEGLIRRLMSRGKRYAIFSASAADASASDREEIEAFFEKYPPVALSLRDNENYEWLRAAVPNAISSICAAFLVGELPVPRLAYDTPYFISNFYTAGEPKFSIGDSWETLKVSSLKTRSPKVMKFLRHLEWLDSGPDMVGKYKVVRVRHETTMKFSHLTFRKLNSYCSMNPVVILSAYEGCDFVVSDRVHACVAGLAFGKPVYLYKVDNRAMLFNQKEIIRHHDNGFMTINSGKLKVARRELLDYIQNTLADHL